MILPYKVIIIPIIAMVGAAVGGAIQDDTISIASVLAVGGVVLPGCWWLGKRFQSIEDRFTEGERRFDQIDAKLLTLPCKEVLPIIVKKARHKGEYPDTTDP